MFHYLDEMKHWREINNACLKLLPKIYLIKTFFGHENFRSLQWVLTEHQHVTK